MARRSVGPQRLRGERRRVVDGGRVRRVEVAGPDGADDALGLVGVVEPREGPLAVLGPDREVGPPQLGTRRVDRRAGRRRVVGERTEPAGRDLERGTAPRSRSRGPSVAGARASGPDDRPDPAGAQDDAGMPAGPSAVVGVAPREHRHHGHRPVEGADQPTGLGALQDARRGVAEAGAPRTAGRSSPKTRSPRSAAWPASSARSSSRSQPRTRIASVHVTSSRRDGSSGVACAGDAQGQRREDGEDPLQGEGNPGADGQREDDAARRRSAVGGQSAGRLGLQPRVLAEVLRRQLEDQRRRLGVGDQLGPVGPLPGLHVAAGSAQLGDDEVLGPEQPDVDRIAGSGGASAPPSSR